MSVAALNTKTGAQFSYGMTSGMRTGSVAKLFVLETVLLQHQDEGTQLSSYELGLATPMIENSDNKAEYSLFLNAGGNQALTSAFPRLGLKHTVPGASDPALTTTDATDGIRLVNNLVRRNGPLNAYSRSLALGLMRNVESDQRWGVSAAADPGTSVALKNGWLSVDNDNDADENDDGRWLVNSVGVVTVHGQQVLLAAFTQHGPDYDSGIDLVESLVKAITPAVVAQ
ncbi:MAG TPA: serine hydrolase [Jatrophihabitantaceae bacterium]